MKEIFCIFDTNAECDGFIKTLKFILEKNHIKFQQNSAGFWELKFKNYILTCHTVYSGMLGLPKDNVTHLLNDTFLSKEEFHKRVGFTFPASTKEIHSRREILDILISDNKSEEIK